MRFTPLTPAKLVVELAEWIRHRAGESVGGGRAPGAGNGTVIGFDGPAEIGTTALADRVAEALRSAGRPAIRASTNWWWRPSALRLELGRQDVDMLLTGWVDADAIIRELIGPVVSGAGPYITRLRDPETDRSVRERPTIAPSGAIVLIDGPFLAAASLPLDALVVLSTGRGALARALPPERGWWPAAFERYQADYRPAESADVVLSYDHRSAPAARGLGAGRFI